MNKYIVHMEQYITILYITIFKYYVYMMNNYIVHLQEYVTIIYIATLRYEVANMKKILNNIIII